MTLGTKSTTDRTPYERAVDLIHALHQSGRLHDMKVCDVQGQVQRECGLTMTEAMVLRLIFDAGTKLALVRRAEAIMRGNWN